MMPFKVNTLPGLALEETLEIILDVVAAFAKLLLGAMEKLRLVVPVNAPKISVKVALRERVVGGLILFPNPLAVLDANNCRKPRTLLPISKAPELKPPNPRTLAVPMASPAAVGTVTIPAAFVVYSLVLSPPKVFTVPETVRLSVSEAEKVSIGVKPLPGAIVVPRSPLTLTAWALAVLKARSEAMPAVVSETFLKVVEMADAERIILVYPMFLLG
jgi:hypothetical protein